MKNHSMRMINVGLQIITCYFLFTATASSRDGFTIDLVHRRSNLSSFRPSSDTELGSPYADIIYTPFYYVMKLQIGTPPVEIEAVLDTGSDLLWTQCLPCTHCYDQGTTPIFDPSKSSTYKDVPCKFLFQHKTCRYTQIYEDQSYSKGTYAKETVTIQSTSGKPLVMPQTTIGCGHDNYVPNPTNASGIVGLNWGSLSLISQMAPYTFEGLFSYCLSTKETSKINFGANAVVAGDGVVATDMFKKSDDDCYYLNLDAVSVGDNRVETLGTSFHATDGNIIIDSGTSFTYLTGSYCNQLMEAVENVVQADRVVEDYGGMLCYNTDNIEIFPVITMHFSGGADLVLDNYNIYLEMGRGVFCMALVCGSDDDVALFGNTAQNNLLVGYDTSSAIISFKPTDCSALWS